MGVSASPAHLSRKITKLAADFADLPNVVVTESARVVKTSTVALATVASGGDLRLSGVGKKGAKVGVRYTIGRYGGESKALIFATGPFHLIESDTKAGVRARRRRRGRGRTRLIGPIQGYYHPGTHGKHPWAKGVAAAEPVVGALFASRCALVIHRTF